MDRSIVTKTIILILTGLLLLSVSLWVIYMKHKERFAMEPASFEKKVTAAWPISGGDSQLTGFTMQIPANPEVLWRYRAGAGVNAGPVSDNGRLFFGDNEKTFYCLDLNTGKLIWKTEIPGGVTASALLVDGLCYFGSSEGIFYAVSVKDGSIIWTFNIKEQINGSANSFKIEDKLYIVFGGYDFKLHCLQAKTGREVWSVSTANYINGAPAISNGKIIFGGCDGFLRFVDAATGDEVGKIKLKSYIPASPAVYGIYVYAAVYDNKLFSFEISDKEENWAYSSKKDSGPFVASPAVNKDYVVIAERNGTVTFVNREDGLSSGSFKVSGEITVRPVVSDSQCLVADKDGYVYIYDIPSGKRAWRYQAGPGIEAQPAVCGDKIIIADNDGNITVFKGTK